MQVEREANQLPGEHFRVRQPADPVMFSEGTMLVERRPVPAAALDAQACEPGDGCVVDAGRHAIRRFRELS